MAADTAQQNEPSSPFILRPPKVIPSEGRRQEAALTSGALAWNRMPTTFQRIRSAKQQRSAEVAAAVGPKFSQTACGPGLLLQPQRAHSAGPKRTMVVSLAQESGCVRPKTANFPARNFLSGYRQMQSRASPRKDDSGSGSRSSFVIGPGNPTGGAGADLDQMNEEELRQIFNELARAGEEEQNERQRKNHEKKEKRARAVKPSCFVLPSATELHNGSEPTTASSSEPDPPQIQVDNVPSGYLAGQCTPTSFRLRPQSRSTHSAKTIGSGKIVQSDDNLVYVPKLKTRYCRIYVGSNVPKPRPEGEEYEFLPMNSRAFLHDPQEKHRRRSRSCHHRQPPVVYSSNFYTSYDHGGRDIYGQEGSAGPELECVMCQHLLRSS